MTSPDQVDNQIENGVDFFPNDDASGFTPKTDLESLYNKVQDGTFDKVWPEAAKINEKTRAAYGADGEYDVPEGVGISTREYSHMTILNMICEKSNNHDFWDIEEIKKHNVDDVIQLGRNKKDFKNNNLELAELMENFMIHKWVQLILKIKISSLLEIHKKE